MAEYLQDAITPKLILKEEILQKNINQTAVTVIRNGSIDLRPHFKTSKMLEVASLQYASGAIGFTCATLSELESLLAGGFSDLFWAHQPIGKLKVAAVISLALRCNLKIALDSLDAARPISDAASHAGIEIPYLIEIDLGLGRAGVLPQDAAVLAQKLHDLPGLSMQGVFGHEGHLYGIRDVKRRSVQGVKVGQAIVNAAMKIRDVGLPCKTISVGSTPALASAPFVDGVTEARPGTYVFNDDNQNYLHVSTVAQCAVRVIARVVSRPRRGVAIIDAGLKAMSSDRSLRNNGFGSVQGLDGIFFETAYEEHGLLTGEEVDRLNVGDLIEIIPNHVCGTINMWSRVMIVKGEAIIGQWDIVGRH